MNIAYKERQLIGRSNAIGCLHLVSVANAVVSQFLNSKVFDLSIILFVIFILYVLV